MHEGGASEVDRSVAQTLEMLATNAKDMEGLNSAQVEGYGEEMMTNMIAEFEKLGEKEDFSQVVDGMMRQLLSKELMYEPMKQVCEKYPEWLAVQAEALTKEDYERCECPSLFLSCCVCMHFLYFFSSFGLFFFFGTVYELTL